MITTVRAPQINTNDDDVEILAWRVESGAYVEAGQEIAELETSKATVSLCAESAGYLDCLLPARATVRVGAAVCRIASSREELDAQQLPQSAAPATALVADAPAGSDAERPGPFASVRFSRTARELLQTHDLSPDIFRGAGLVTARDVEHALGVVNGGEIERRPPATLTTAAAEPLQSRGEPLSLAKRAEVSALSIGASGHINSTLSVRFDSQPLRQRLRTEQLFDGNPLPLVLYEISRLLKEWPQFTAFCGDDGIHYYGRIDLGLAMDLGKGLKVVTLRAADRLTPLELFERTLDFGARYLDNRLQPHELGGSTLTVTDLSGFDVLQFQPLINGRQSAIIGLGADGTLAGHPMTLNMTFDHRVATGRDVALFLGQLRSRLLSYAPPVSTRLPDPQAAAPAAAASSAATPGVCERCGVDIASYYRGFARDGYMLAFHRQDGSLGSVCHRCFGSWN